MDHKHNNLVMANPDRAEMKENVAKLSEILRNPYQEMLNWLKGEVMDLQALLEAISHKEGIEGQRNRAEKNKKDNKGSLDKINAGKSTFKTFFKGSSGKASEITNLTTQIAQSDKDIEFLEKIVHVLAIYLAEKVVPDFKRHKIQ